MDLRAYLAILWGNKWVILATTAITVAVVTASTLLSTPVYSATTTLRVASASGATGGYSDYVYTDRLMNTYTKIATSSPVWAELGKRLDLQSGLEIQVETVPYTELIQITVESPNPALAQAAANTLAEILIAQSIELYSGGGKSPQEILSEQLAQAEAELNQARQEYELLILQSPEATERISAASQKVELKEGTYASLMDQYEQARLRETIRANTISVVEPAGLPRSPSKPRTVLNIGLGFLIGLVAGVSLAFLFENLGRKLYTSEQIEAVTELPSLGKIPRANPKSLSTFSNGVPKNGHSSRGHPGKNNAPLQEAFRRLRTNIIMKAFESSNSGPLITFLVTSAEPGEGKSTVVTNLAQALAQAGHKVFVVDCDMRLPRLHKLYGLPNLTGLSDVLKQQVTWEKAVQATRYPGMQVLTSGPVPLNPSELLGSPQMKVLLEQIGQAYDLVLLDGPALLAVTDAAVLAQIVDGVVLVARRNQTRVEAVREACQQLDDIKAHMVGLVVNEAEASGSYYYRGR